MDFLRIPGAAVTSIADKETFDDVRAMIDKATSDILSHPDWNEIIQIVDAVNSINNDTLRNEVIFVIKRKLASSKSKTVFLAITLVEALVKNGGARVHGAVGTEPFMKEMAKVARRFNGRGGSESMEVSELVLDVIQAWGEAFLSRKKHYPAFVNAYHDLRKEGLQFKAQYDVNRVPIFEVGGSKLDSAEDSAILRAAMAASVDVSSDMPSRSSGSSKKKAAANRARSPDVGIESSGVSSASEDVLQAVIGLMSILCEIITASKTVLMLKENDTAIEVADQLRSLQDSMTQVIEYELNNMGEGTEILFKINDDAQMLLAAYDGAVIGQCSLNEVMDVVGAIGSTGDQSSNTAATATPNATSAPSQREEPNLLDFFDSAPSVQQTPWNTPVQPAVMQQGFSFESHIAPAAAVPALSASTLPSTSSSNFDPFASDIDPFGPGTSSIDDLLATTVDAKPAATDIFSSPAVVETAAVKRPYVDPMAGFNTNMFSQPPPLPISTSPATATVTSGISSSGSGFDVFDGLGAMSMPSQGHQQIYQHPISQPQQQGYAASVSPPTYGAPMQANYSSSFHSGAPSFGPSNQYPQQVPNYQQQQQQQGGYGFPPPPQQQQQSNMYGMPPMQAAPPLPSSPPPAAPHQQQQQQQHNPFDGF